MADGDVLQISSGHQVFAPSGGGGGVSVTTSDTDPGAIGAGNFWLASDPNNLYETTQLYVRNANDDGWDAAGAGMAYRDNAQLSGVQVGLVPHGYEEGSDIGLFVSPGSGSPASGGYAQLACYSFNGEISAVITTNETSINIGFVGPAPDSHYATIYMDATGIGLFTDGALTFNGNPIGTQAAHVANGSTVDQLRDALIASGLMAAS